MTSKFALITPSYYGDYERCKLLVESVANCIIQKAPFYVIVPRKDVNLFQNLKKIYPISIIEEEKLLPWYVFNTPLSRKWRLNIFGMPLRGWIVQQICKLNAFKIVNEEVMVILDSDVCFIKRLDLNDFVKNDKVRLLSIEGRGNQPEHYPWHRVSAKLLHLPIVDYFGNGYIGNVITWKRENVLKLHKHLKSKSKFYLLRITNQITFSEYVLYGVFCDFILGDQSGHYEEQEKGVKEYWTEKQLTDEELEGFFGSIDDEFAIMITAKAGVSIDRIRERVKFIWGLNY